MNGPIAQIVALTCHANAVLRGIAVAPFFSGNSTCQFCDSVTFTRQSWWWMQNRTVAQTPDEWFARLSAGKAKGVRLSWQSQNDHGIRDRQLAGLVGGGGEWAMEVVQAGGKSTLWTAIWEVWNQIAPN
ncbi:MAG: hypothetical protein JNG89_21715, partial [Planctomycetaceae bacterium]|nr:hypothetical protein [Planctomycetaceae bacterium]